MSCSGTFICRSSSRSWRKTTGSFLRTRPKHSSSWKSALSCVQPILTNWKSRRLPTTSSWATPVSSSTDHRHSPVMRRKLITTTPSRKFPRSSRRTRPCSRPCLRIRTQWLRRCLTRSNRACSYGYSRVKRPGWYTTDPVFFGVARWLTFPSVCTRLLTAANTFWTVTSHCRRKHMIYGNGFSFPTMAPLSQRVSPVIRVYGLSRMNHTA